jgi:ribosomal protein S27AE
VTVAEPLTLRLDDAHWRKHLTVRLGEDARPPLHAIGPVSLVAAHKTAFFCSARCPGGVILAAHDQAARWRDEGRCVIGDFHAPVEKRLPPYSPTWPTTNHHLPRPRTPEHPSATGLKAAACRRPAACPIAIPRIRAAGHQGTGRASQPTRRRIGGRGCVRSNYPGRPPRRAEPPRRSLVHPPDVYQIAVLVAAGAERLDCDIAIISRHSINSLL